MSVMDVYPVEVGEYEQAGIVALFTTEALATAYAETRGGYVLPPLQVLDELPVPVTHYHYKAVCGEQSPGWKRIPGGSEQRESWESDSNYCPQACESEVCWWIGREGPVYVGVDGYDREQVEAEFDRLCAGVWDDSIRPEARP